MKKEMTEDEFRGTCIAALTILISNQAVLLRHLGLGSAADVAAKAAEHLANTHAMSRKGWELARAEVET